MIDWNIYLYIAEEDKSLASMFFMNLKKMLEAVRYQNLNIFILHRAANFYGSYRMKLVPDGNEIVPFLEGESKIPHGSSASFLETISEDIDMLNPETLTQFVLSNKREYPAKKHALFLQCHSNGWFAKQSFSEKRIKSYPELLSGLRDEISLEILGLNSCYISNIEIVYEVRKLTKYVIATEVSSPIIPIFSPTFFYAFSKYASSEEIATQICADYIVRSESLPKELVEGKFYVPTDISLLSTAGVDELLKEVLEVDLSRIDRSTYEASMVNPEGYESEAGEHFITNDLYTAVRMMKRENFGEFEKRFRRVVMLYIQTRALREKEWSVRMNGLGWISCPYKKREYGWSYRSMEIYKYWEKMLNCEYVEGIE